MRNNLKVLVKPKVSFKDIAERYGCTIGFVCHIAEGRSKPPKRFQLLCSQMLDLPVDAIFPEENPQDEK